MPYDPISEREREREIEYLEVILGIIEQVRTLFKCSLSADRLLRSVRFSLKWEEDARKSLASFHFPVSSLAPVPLFAFFGPTH
jgi:hypothetical protein